MYRQLIESLSFQELITIHGSDEYVALLVTFAFIPWYSKKYGLKKRTGFLYSLFMIVLLVASIYLVQWITNVIWGINYLNSARSLLFTLCFTYLGKKIWNIDVLHGADFITPSIFLIRGIGMVGCVMLGCGQAVPCSWGIFNPNYGCNVFPMDLIDMTATILIAIVSVIYAKRLNYHGNGRIFALSMYTLGFVRLFIQFGSTEYWWIRGFNDESVYSIVSIIMAIVIYRNWQIKYSVHAEKK